MTAFILLLKFLKLTKQLQSLNKPGSAWPNLTLLGPILLLRNLFETQPKVSSFTYEEYFVVV